MKHLKLVLVLLAFLNGNGYAQNGSVPMPVTEEWGEYVSENGNFRILAPGSMTEKVDSIETKIGKVAYHTFFYQDDRKDADIKIFMVSYCDYPESSVHSDSLDLIAPFFEETMDAAVFSIDGDLAYWDEIKLYQYPGRFWRVNYLNDQALIKTKAYLVRNRFYSLQTVMLKSKSMNTSSERFLDSFRLLD